MVRASTQNYFDGCFGVLLGRCRFPSPAVEPFRSRRKTLGFQKRRPKVCLLGAGELDVMGEFMDQLIAQSGSRPRDPDHDRGGIGPVLATGIELPCRAQGGRCDTVPARRMGCQEVLPGLSGEGAEIIGDRGIESESRCRIGAGDQQDSGSNPRGYHYEDDGTTHTARLLPFGVIDRCRLQGRHKNRPRSPVAKY